MNRILRCVLFIIAVVSPAFVSHATVLPLAPIEFRSAWLHFAPMPLVHKSPPSPELDDLPAIAF